MKRFFSKTLLLLTLVVIGGGIAQAKDMPDYGYPDMEERPHDLTGPDDVNDDMTIPLPDGGPDDLAEN